MYFDIIIAGFGGQGVMFIGNLLAYAAMEEGRQVTYMPVYGVEMRGGRPIARWWSRTGKSAPPSSITRFRPQ